MNTTDSTDPLQILEAAVTKSEMDLLLQGREPYAYLPPRSPSNGPSDLVELLRIAYEVWPVDDRERLRNSIVDALRKIITTYEGLEPVATCLLMETLRQFRKRDSLDLPVAELTISLSESIEKYREKLKRDYSGMGARFVDGQLGELRRVSGIVKSLGGDEFVTKKFN